MIDTWDCINSIVLLSSNIYAYKYLLTIDIHNPLITWENKQL